MPRRAKLILTVAAAAAACMAVAASASAAPARPSGAALRLATGNPWGQAQEVPGLAALSKGHETEIYTISCTSAGNCTAGGDYTVGSVGSFRQEAVAVSEVHGRWRKPEEVTGDLHIAATSIGGGAGITSMSCASAGNCSAGGDYSGRGGHPEVFVVSEVHGRWRKAEEVPGTAALNTGGDAQMISVSCGSAGNCSAGGNYAAGLTGDGEPGSRPFVVSEVRGRWRKAEEVPGIAALNTRENAQITSVSCASAGNCSAGGYYVGHSGEEAFVVSKAHGRWRKAEEVPGTAALAIDGAQITSVSCASADNCSAGGWYVDGSDQFQAFVVSEVRGRWRKAEEVPGTAALNIGGEGQITSMSCASPGNCSAGGDYVDGSRAHSQVFAVSEVNGRWRKAEEVPGTGDLNIGGFAQITSMSCASPGNCSMGGDYEDAPYDTRPFVVSEVNGAWRKAEEVPGIANLNTGNPAVITALSCGSAGHCSAVGSYTVVLSSGRQRSEAFVVSRK